MRSLIAYFCKKPLVVNVILFFVIFCAGVLWTKIGKEELPEFSMNFLRCNIPYPGASAQDVELFISKPIEENLKGVSGLYEVTSTSSYGAASFRITVDPHIRDFAFREKVQDIKEAIERTDLPRESEDPIYSEFNSEEKAIMDLGLYIKGKKILQTEDRQQLQAYALALKNKLLSLPEVSAIRHSGYRRPEIQIELNSAKLEKNQISVTTVANAITKSHVRVPAGNMTDVRESEISLLGELRTTEAIDQTIVQSGFGGQRILVKDLGKAQHGFERTNTLLKVQGHEAVIFEIQKSSSSDILTAQKKIVNFVDQYEKEHHESGFTIHVMDDESYDVRNRLSIIGSNGIIGFLLIVFVLFLFLNFSTGFWVAMGIPFSLAVTLIGAMLLGFTINNMTLASIIIVLGIVVDDAIIIAEKITRKLSDAQVNIENAVDSTMSVLKPVLASILTTCAAFIPLYFFTGRFGLFVKYIPTVIFLMLFASLIESAFILPVHMIHPLPFTKYFKRSSEYIGRVRTKFVSSVEQKYHRFLSSVLPLKNFIFLLFIIMLALSGYYSVTKMKYVMFPREETTEIAVRVTGPEGINRYQMSELITPLEQMFLEDDQKIVEIVRTSIGQSRRGGEVKENEASLRIELVAPDQRDVSLKDILPIWEEKAKAIPGLTEVRILKSWWGSDSGSPIEIEVQENNDELRNDIVTKLESALLSQPDVTHVEVERPVTKQQFKLNVDKAKASRLQIDISEMASSIRSYVEGNILYTLIDGDEEVDVRLTSQANDKQTIDKILQLYTSNNDQYLVPIGNVVTVETVEKPANIVRANFKRTTKVYADMSETKTSTPLEVAQALEKDVFPTLTKGNPTTSFQFRGEIEDSRESQGDFLMSIGLVLLLIYMLLVFLYNSLFIPILIGLIIPFGFVGVIWAFMAHGMLTYGFFAVVGTLGMTGVVINDAIVMIDLLESEVNKSMPLDFAHVSRVCTTRLRPIILTSLTTVAGIFPTAYGIAGYDSILAEMMLAMGWGLIFGTLITLVLVPCLYVAYFQIVQRWNRASA